MKYSNLLIATGSLLATTALSTASFAASISLADPNVAAATNLGLRNISAQSFTAAESALTSTPTGANKLVIRFGQNTNSAFTGEINVTGAKFVTAGISSGIIQTAKFVGASIPASIDTISSSSTAACTIQAGVSVVILTCDTSKVSGTTVTSSSVNGLIISGFAFDNVGPLATAGSSVSLDFIMKSNPGLVTLDSAAATAVITSRNSITATSTSATAALIDVSATPAAFNKLVGSVTAAVIGSINFTLGAGSTLPKDLSTALTAATTVGSTEVKITSPIFPATAVAALGANSSGISSVTLTSGGSGTVTGTYSNTVTQFGAGFVTFAVPAASIIDQFLVNVNFNGTTEIAAAAAGTTTFTYTSVANTAGTGNAIAPPAGSGTVGGLTRNGFNIDFNGVQPGTAQGARTYTSLIRISNTGLVGGTVSIIVANETTGTVLGTYTSASIPAGASLQVSSAQIEAGAGITASASVLYRLAISGAITGYAQHVNWNQDAGFFSDLSSRRTEKVGSGL